MKQFVGGITKLDGQIQLNLQINGGESYMRIYESKVDTALAKLCVVEKALNRISLEVVDDAKFYISQLMDLFQFTNIQFLSGSNIFQVQYNSRVLQYHIDHIIEKFNPTDILELLGLTKILSEANNDVNFDIQTLDIQESYLDEIIENESETLINSVQRVRDSFTMLCSLINEKREEIQKYYDDMINDMKSQL